MTTTYADLLKADENVRSYRDADPKLAECRGYVFSLNNADPGLSEDRVDAIVMGMNPGEAPARDDGVSPTSKGNWARLCQSAADSVGGKWAISEMFFWSSHDLAALKQRVGDFAPYLEFCAKQNLIMIAYHKPKVVFQPGLGWLKDARAFYDLTWVDTIWSPRRRRRLIEHYRMADGTDWLCTPHWTASFGFSGDDLEQIKNYAATLPARLRDETAAHAIRTLGRQTAGMSSAEILKARDEGRR